jgi:hypothetical protein
MQLRLSQSARVAVLGVWAIALQAGGIAAATAAQGAPDGGASVAPPAIAGLGAAAVPFEVPTTTTTTIPPSPTGIPVAVSPTPKVVAVRAAAPASPAPPSSPPAPAPSPAQRVRAAFDSSVPPVWRSAISVRFEIIPGGTSWGYPDGLVQIGTYHANGSTARLRATVAHEFGHLIAFRYGSRAYNGAAPTGWPAYGSNPAEAWADCVSQAFTGVIDPSHGLPPCQGESLAWTQAWLAHGPPSG